MSVMYVSSYFGSFTYKHDGALYRNFAKHLNMKDAVFIKEFRTDILYPNLQFWIQHIVRRKVRYFE